MPSMNTLNESLHSILLVEDEESLARGLIYNLEAEGYRVHHVEDGLAALKAFQSQSFDMVILDIMLPHLDGFEVASRIREVDPQMPILMLTARTSLKDRLKGLETGADDYLSKPFHLEELLLRVKGILKRKSWYKVPLQNHPVYRFGDNEINFENLHCRARKRSFVLTPLEAMVMKYLIENKDRIVSRRELLDKVWNIASEIETRTVDNFILRLRKYFESDPSQPVYIKSVRGSGYIFSDQ